MNSSRYNITFKKLKIRFQWGYFFCNFKHDFYNNFDESDSEEDDEENENLSQDSSWVDINGSGSEISGISYATNSGNGSEISNNRNPLNDNEERSMFYLKLIIILGF